MIMTIEEHPISKTLHVETSLCPSESVGANLTLRTTILEDGRIVAAAPLPAKQGLRALTDEWGLQISGMAAHNLVDHANALEAAVRTVYGTLAAEATTGLHHSHLLLLRQERFFVAHLGASDIYLIRDRKVHPLALAPSLRKLEESLGFEFDNSAKLEPERICCGSFSWPDPPSVQLVSAGYRTGDYLLFTSPGLFEQRDWPGILGSVASAGRPFEQAAVRLARLGQARRHADSDGYLLVHVVSEGESRPPAAAHSPEETRQAAPLAAAGAPKSEEAAAPGHYQYQIEFASATGEGRPGGSSPAALGIAVAGLLGLFAVLFLLPYLRSTAVQAPERSERGGRTTSLAARTPVGSVPPGSEVRAAGAAAPELQTPATPLPARQSRTASETAPTAEAGVPAESSAVADAPAAETADAPSTAADYLALDATPSEGDPFNRGRDLVLSGKLAQSSSLFREYAASRPQAYTIQVGVVSKADTILTFFENASEGIELMLLQAPERSFLTIGLYETQKDAWTAVQKLPEFFRKQNAVVKPIGQILAEVPAPKPTARPKARSQPTATN
jgi:septal ring-binding cell division protein DamX